MSGNHAASGVRSYNVQYRDSDRPNAPWHDWVVNRNADRPYELFTGQPGHTYFFRCQATDHAGNTDPYPNNPDASIRVDPASRPPTPWWNGAYGYKRNLTILNNMASVVMPVGYPVHLHFDSGTTPTAAELYGASQSTTKCDDLRIVSNDTAQLNRVRDTCSASAIDIWSRSQVSITGGGSDSTSHQLYYDNPSAVNPPAQRSLVFYPAIDAYHLRVFDMREGQGSTVHDATGNGDATLGSELTWQSGKFGPAVRIPGDLTPEPRPAINAGYGPQPSCDFTVEMWVRRLDGHHYDSVLAQQEIGWDDPSRWVFAISGDHLRLGIADRGDAYSNATVGAATFFDNWHHLAATYRCDGEIRFYIDGRLDTTQTLPSGGLNSASAPLHIGNNVYQTNRIGADVWGFALSNAVRTNFTYGQFADVKFEPTLATGQALTPPEAGSPDLVIQDLATYPHPAGGIIVQATVENQGNLETQNGFFTDLYLNVPPSGVGDYASLQFWVNQPIAAGDTVQLTTVITDIVGLGTTFPQLLNPTGEANGTLYAQTDTAGAVPESNDGNNIFTNGTGFCVAAADAYEAGSGATNELSNSGFENGSGGNPTGWQQDAWMSNGATFKWDNVEAHNGDRSAMLQATTANDIRWIQAVTLQPNTNYRLSGWIKTENVVHDEGTQVAGANLGLYGTWLHTDGLFGTNDWTYVSMEFDSGAVTETDIAARLGYWSGIATGTAWFDDIQLVNLDALNAGDDLPGTATTIELGAKQTHNFDRPGDEDWFRFTAEGGKTYTLHTSDLGASADTYLYLYAPDATTLLASNDDYEGSLASLIEWTAPTNGTYYMLVRHWNPNAGGCGTGYEIEVYEGSALPVPELYLPVIAKPS